MSSTVHAFCRSPLVAVRHSAWTATSIESFSGRSANVVRNDVTMQVTIETLWRTATEQCELVVLGLQGCRLRLWIKGALVVDEVVSSWPDAVKRAAELRIEWPRLVE